MNRVLISILLAFAAFGDFLLGILLIKKGRKEKGTFIFAEFCLWVGLWTIGILGFRITNDLRIALFWNRMFIFAAGMIAISFLRFSYKNEY